MATLFGNAASELCNRALGSQVVRLRSSLPAL